MNQIKSFNGSGNANGYFSSGNGEPDGSGTGKNNSGPSLEASQLTEMVSF